jgi:hypothetical protein
MREEKWNFKGLGSTLGPGPWALGHITKETTYGTL